MQEKQQQDTAPAPMKGAAGQERAPPGGATGDQGTQDQGTEDQAEAGRAAEAGRTGGKPTTAPAQPLGGGGAANRASEQQKGRLPG